MTHYGRGSAIFKKKKYTHTRIYFSEMKDYYRILLRLAKALNAFKKLHINTSALYILNIF